VPGFLLTLSAHIRSKKGQIKTGAPCRSERVAKYNALIRIADELKQAGQEVVYAGAQGLSRGPTVSLPSSILSLDFT
jgi:hypothetical protein